MARSIYSNNDVNIEMEFVDGCEAKINCNGKNLIWISAEDSEAFKRELAELMDKYRI